MQIGMTLPVMESDVSAQTLRRWAATVDEGPFSSLCWGERIAFANPDSLTLLGALSGWTERVRLVATVIVAQLHDPVLLAKALATADQFSSGRLTVGLGVGGRHEDYRAVGADPATQTRAVLAERAATLKAVWAGRRVTDAVEPVGPAPAQPGGPPLLVGATGEKTLRSAAGWADGLAGITLDLDREKQRALFEVAHSAWSAAGKDKPHLATSFWYALGEPDAARAQMHRHLRHYINWLPRSAVDELAPHTGFAGTDEDLAAVLRGFADIGTDEVYLIPTSDDITQLQRAAAVVADLAATG
ncbi:LLM class flavin-dependent oxidoreductase [Mycolicibacillus koreensis]|nr:LLM class flavin-dependent oxidoreductase [Mycolicibacillus koreensis]BBY52883.1 luciferase [Mycolicibacillus koreensis]